MSGGKEKEEMLCAQCDKPLGNSVSDDFCSEQCTRYWLGERIGIKPPPKPTAPAHMHPNLAAAWGFIPAPAQPTTGTEAA